MKIDGEKQEIYLKSPSDADAGRVAKIANEYDIAYSIAAWGSFPHPYGAPDALSFIKRAAQDQMEGIGIHLAIRLVKNDELIGMIGFKEINARDRKAEIGYWIGKDFWGKGYGTTAVAMMLAYGFETLHLNKIYAKVFAFNKASLRILEKMGFEKEGLLKQDTFHKDEFVDEVLIALLSKNYKHKVKVNLLP